jgi:hypothetical protein
VLLTDNVLTRIDSYGVYAGPRYLQPATALNLQRNRITASATYAYPLYVSSGHLASIGNRYAGGYYGPYLYNYSGSGWQLGMTSDTIIADSALGGTNLSLSGAYAGSIRKSRIEGGGYGLDANLTGGSLTLDSNVVTGTRSYAMQLSGPAGASFSGQYNNVSSNAGYGIQTLDAASYSFTNGRFVGNRSYAIQELGSQTVNATNNWWGAASGPGGGVADSVQNSVTTSPFLTSDPAGISVPPLAPAGNLFAADLWRAPSRAGAAAPAAGPPPVPQMVDDRAERAAARQERRSRAEARAVELRQSLERRKAERAAHQLR